MLVLVVNLPEALARDVARVADEHGFADHSALGLEAVRQFVKAADSDRPNAQRPKPKARGGRRGARAASR